MADQPIQWEIAAHYLETQVPAGWEPFAVVNERVRIGDYDDFRDQPMVYYRRQVTPKEPDNA